MMFVVLDVMSDDKEELLLLSSPSRSLDLAQR